ncbi:MAG: hypothetical protein ACTSQB_06680 [Candidatus Heimdallarchaeota archaeon]
MNKEFKEIDKFLMKLSKIKNEFRKEFMKAKKFDVEHILKLEANLKNEYKKISSDIHKVKIKEASLLNAKIEAAVKANAKFSIKPLITKIHETKLARYVYRCGCLYDSEEENEHPPEYMRHEGNDEDITIIPEGADRVDISKRYDNNLIRSYTSVEVDCNIGETRYVEIARTFVYRYKTPHKQGTLKTYCIRPEFVVNGWGMLWTWGGGCGSDADRGTATFDVTVEFDVQQIGDSLFEGTEKPSKNIIHLEHSDVGTYENIETGIYYSTFDNEKLMAKVELLGSEDTIIFVRCITKIEAANNVLAIVDLGSTDGTYFWVPEVKAGPYIPCFRIWDWKQELLATRSINDNLIIISPIK